MAEDSLSPPDSVTLHRLVWHPDCYDDGKLTSSGAFPSQDLKGDRFVSVDRHDLFNIEIARSRAQSQQAKANGTDKIREDAMVADFPCGGVRDISDSEGKLPFKVTSEAEPDNPAHCGIRNTSGKKSRGYINQIRAKLMQIKLKEWELKL